MDGDGDGRRRRTGRRRGGKGEEACLPSIAAVFWLVGVGEVLLVSRGDWARQQNQTISWS